MNINKAEGRRQKAEGKRKKVTGYRYGQAVKQFV
jgi:uncharacterized protein YjbJ (UPF0337 family)